VSSTGSSVSSLDRVDLAELVGAFGNLLHAAGIPVSPDRSGRFARAVALVRPDGLDEWYWAGRVTLLSGHDDIETYDRVFAQVFRGFADVADWRGQAPPPTGLRPARPGSQSERDREPGSTGRAPPGPSSAGGDVTTAGEGASTGIDGPDLLAAASAEERLRHTDLADLTDDELAALSDLMAALPPAAPRRASRRTVRHPHGRRLDLRATLRRARATGGDPVRRVHRRRTARPRHLVLIADVSGSMAPYARVLLQYLHAAVATHRRVEVFAFGTRLTRLTRELAVRDPDLALARASEAVEDWSGGTRIGHSLGLLNREYGRRLGRGAVVVILSDGWDRGEPDVLADEMARLRRSSHRVIWLNPLKAAPDYEPLARGMAAALPHTDHFLAGNSLASLAELATILEDTR
jgi:uncharacterized protein